MKVYCSRCNTPKNIPDKTQNWQCPICSVVNFYDVPKEKPKKKHSNFPKAFLTKIEDQNEN